MRPQGIGGDFSRAYLSNVCVAKELQRHGLGHSLIVKSKTVAEEWDVDECKEKLYCQCSQCNCKNTWGGYECSCSGDRLYMQEHDICISNMGGSGMGWGSLWMILLGLVAAGAGAYAVYKYRIRRYMDSEIRAIMAQYMPLDNQVEFSIQIVRTDI